MAVAARFYVSKITKHAHQVRAGYAEPAPMGTVSLQAVSRGEANAQWASATPSGSIELTTKAGAFEWFEARLGDEVSITFDDVPEHPEGP